MSRTPVVPWVLLTVAFHGRPDAGAALPAVGIAVRDGEGGWCASVADPLDVGAGVTLVFPDSGSPAVTRAARVTRRRPDPCPSEFPQLSLEGLPAYDVVADGPAAEGMRSVALLVAGAVPWRRDPDGAARADLDGDGRAEEARVCAADEGEHFTLWTTDRDGVPRRRWHGYYDWGAIVDPTCRPGEDGREPA